MVYGNMMGGARKELEWTNSLGGELETVQKQVRPMEKLSNKRLNSKIIHVLDNKSSCCYFFSHTSLLNLMKILHEHEEIPGNPGPQ